jgi:hypothetical protein
MPARAGVYVLRHRNDQASLGIAERRDILGSSSRKLYALSVRE